MINWGEDQGMSWHDYMVACDTVVMMAEPLTDEGRRNLRNALEEEAAQQFAERCAKLGRIS